MIHITEADVNQAICEAITTFSPVYIDDDSYKEFSTHCKPYPFLVSNEGICALMKKSSGKAIECKIQPISSFVAVKHKLFNFETNEMSLALEINNGVNMIDEKFSRTILNKLEIKALLKYGVKFLENYSDMLIRYLLISENSADTVYVFDSIGWGRLNGVSIFKYNQIMCPSKFEGNFQSTYAGSLDIQPHGSLEKWLSMLKTEVIGNIPLTVCALLGFASPILASITEKYDLGSLIFSLSNDSSKGKSTSAMLASSIFSNPKLNRGTMRSFNSTQNFLVTFLSQISGLPVSLDEASEFVGDMNQLLYLLSSGVEKGRLNGNSEMKPEKSWESIILTTSEIDTLSENDQSGLNVRCFVIHDELTTSALNADHIRKAVLTNYGVAGRAYIQWLLDNKVNQIENDYLKAKKQLIQESLKTKKPSPLTKRILSKLAVVLVAARYARKCFGLDIDIDDIETYLLNIERQVAVKTDFAMSSLDTILQEISRNSLKFLTSDRPSGQNIVGKISEEEEYKTIAILKTEFQSYCSKNKIQNPHKVLTKLKKDGILQCETDRLTKRVRLAENMPLETCYILKVPDASSPSRQTGNQLPKLTSDDELNF